MWDTHHAGGTGERRLERQQSGKIGPNIGSLKKEKHSGGGGGLLQMLTRGPWQQVWKVEGGGSREKFEISSTDSVPFSNPWASHVEMENTLGNLPGVKDRI